MSKKSRLAKEIDGVMEANAAVNKKAKDTSPVPTKKVKDTSPVVHQNSKIKFDSPKHLEKIKKWEGK